MRKNVKAYEVWVLYRTVSGEPKHEYIEITFRKKKLKAITIK